MSNEGIARRSIGIRMIRHAESKNNQVYRDARRLFKGGTTDFDKEGWINYVNLHRSHDPAISPAGEMQAESLKEYLAPHLNNQASHPVRIITSPMRRTMQTILPTLKELKGQVEILVNGLYFESEGCHIKGQPHPGMNQIEIKEFLSSATSSPKFVGFDQDPTAGWYAHGTGFETRAESEERAVAFYTWLCDYLDLQLQSDDEDLFDAGVALPGEVGEIESDKLSPRQRRRRTAVLIGHGDFMSLVLKRIVAGFGHSIENDGIPHRSAFVHFNTGITELEYFGRGRFLVMHTNDTPHLNHDISLKTGGGLKDGWSYLMPSDENILYEEVTSAFADEHDKHVLEQVHALRKLYLVDSRNGTLLERKGSSVTDTEGDNNINNGNGSEATTKAEMNNSEMIFVVKRGSQVTGCITFDENKAELSDLAIRPSVRNGTVGKDLIQAVKDYAIKTSKTELVARTSEENRHWFEGHEFVSVDSDDDVCVYKLCLAKL